MQPRRTWALMPCRAHLPFPQVRTLYLVSGTYDLWAFVVARPCRRSPVRFSEVAPLRRPGTVTHFLLKRYKEDGEILYPGGDDKRQPLSI